MERNEFVIKRTRQDSLTLLCDDYRELFTFVMPPLGWRKAVDGAKNKKSADQAGPSTIYNKPPAVPERTGIVIEALGGTSLGVGNTLLQPAEHSKLNSIFIRVRLTDITTL